MKLSPNRKTRLRQRIEQEELGADISLLPTQHAFASSSCRHKAYIGPMGSGKSLVLCLLCLVLASSVPGNAGVIGRFARSDFNRTNRVRLEELLIPSLVERELPNGEGWLIRTSDPNRPSTLWTAHYDEAGPYRSMDLGFFAIDEVNGDDVSPSVPEDVYNTLVSRLGRLAHVRRPYGLLAGNPQGHNWVWDKFHGDSPRRLPDHQMFTPQPYENAPNLQAGYYERLVKTMGPEWVARYVMGSHDTFEGQVYGELSPAAHIVDPFPIPATWPRIIALDYGARNPTCVLFIAVNTDGALFVYDEHYEPSKAIPYHAEKIKQRLPNMEHARSIRWPADPSIFAKTMQKAGKTFSVFDEYADAGLDQWEPGENDNKAGRERVKEYLRSEKLFFFRDHCPNLWRELTQLHWHRSRSLGDVNPKEEEADKDNHGPDALRYAVMSRPESAKPEKIPAPPATIGEARQTKAHRLYKAALKNYRSTKDSMGSDEDKEYV